MRIIALLYGFHPLSVGNFTWSDGKKGKKGEKTRLYLCLPYGLLIEILTSKHHRLSKPHAYIIHKVMGTTLTILLQAFVTWEGSHGSELAAVGALLAIEANQWEQR